MGLLNILARITLDSTQFEAGLKRADSAVTSLAKKLAGAFTGAAIGMWIKSSVDAATAAADLAEQLGITVEQVQALEDAAGDSGIELGRYADALQKVKKAQAEALSGNKAMQQTFATLGINARDSAFSILQQIGKATGPTQTAAAYDILGKGNGKMLGSLSSIRSDQFAVSSETAKELDTVSDRFSSMVRFFKRVTAEGIGIGAKNLNLLSRFFPENARFAPLPLPQQAIGIDEDIEKNMSALGEDFKKRRKARRDLERSLLEPINQTFQSSSMNDRARIGGFFIGADATARMDIQRQQLQKQTVMADRIAKIEEQMRKLTEEE